MEGILALRWLSILMFIFWVWFSITSAQPPTDSACSSINSYISSHPNCYIDDLSGGGCSGFFCYSKISYLSVFVEECQDPVSIVIHYEHYGDVGSTYNVDFQYVFNQSEVVDNDGIYSYGDTERYTVTMARNASHVGFELYIDRDDQDPETLVNPVYFPLNPAHCMCDSMQEVAGDIDMVFSCNTTISDECTGIQCTAEDNILKGMAMNVSQCDDPPTVTLGVVVNETTYTELVTGNTTMTLDAIGITLAFTVWYYKFSMDLQVVASDGDVYQEILSRHKIILDLTSCGPPQPFDLSTAPLPTTEFTEPTIPTSTTTDSSYDTCTALQSISVADGTLCNTNDACTALECEIVDQRLEIQVDQCHDPPGIVVILYNSMDQPVYNQSFYNGSTFVNDSQLPVDLNVTVEQHPPDAIIVEVLASICSNVTLPVPAHIILVPRTVVPINQSSCITPAPPTAAPTPTCSAMQDVQRELSSHTVNPCYFPDDHNCSTLTCPGIGDELTIRILRCANPPAVRIIYHTAIGTTFDHVFNQSEFLIITGFNEVGFNVTLDQLCPSDIGLQIDIGSQNFGSSTIVPYTVIPINTTGCGPDSGSATMCSTMGPASNIPSTYSFPHSHTPFFISTPITKPTSSVMSLTTSLAGSPSIVFPEPTNSLASTSSLPAGMSPRLTAEPTVSQPASSHSGSTSFVTPKPTESTVYQPAPSPTGSAHSTVSVVSQTVSMLTEYQSVARPPESTIYNPVPTASPSIVIHRSTASLVSQAASTPIILSRSIPEHTISTTHQLPQSLTGSSSIVTSYRSSESQTAQIISSGSRSIFNGSKTAFQPAPSLTGSPSPMAPRSTESMRSQTASMLTGSPSILPTAATEPTTPLLTTTSASSLPLASTATMISRPAEPTKYLTPTTSSTAPPGTGSLSTISNPTHSTGSEPTPTTIPPVSGTTCDAMAHITDQINNLNSDQIIHMNCTRENCGEIECKGENITLNLSLSCSPIGMIIGAAVVDMSGFLAENTTLFTESGVFADDLNVTIHTYTDNVLGFGLTVWDPAANVPIDVPLVHYTLIPLDYCDSNSGDAEPHPLNMVAVGVIVPFIVLLTLVIIITLITVVYFVRRRRYRHYQFHHIPMSRLDDE